MIPDLASGMQQASRDCAEGKECNANISDKHALVAAVDLHSQNARPELCSKVASIS